MYVLVDKNNGSEGSWAKKLQSLKTNFKEKERIQKEICSLRTIRSSTDV